MYQVLYKRTPLNYHIYYKIKMMILFSLIIYQIYALTFTTKSFQDGGQLPSQVVFYNQFTSTIKNDGTLKYQGNMPQLSVSGGTVSHFLHIFCQITNLNILWGAKNIKITSDPLILTKEMGQFLDSDFKTSLSITTNSYLGPNIHMFNQQKKSYTFIISYSIGIYQTNSQSNDITLANLKNNANNLQNLQFKFKNTPIRLETDSFVNNAVIGDQVCVSNQFASQIYSNGSLKNEGKIINLNLSGVLKSQNNNERFYHLYCQSGSKYLWGIKNINSTQYIITFQQSIGQWIQSSYKNQFKITKNGYLGPNYNMTNGLQTSFYIKVFATQAPIIANTISELSIHYVTTSNTQTNFITFKYTGKPPVIIPDPTPTDPDPTDPTDPTPTDPNSTDPTDPATPTDPTDNTDNTTNATNANSTNDSTGVEIEGEKVDILYMYILGGSNLVIFIIALIELMIIIHLTGCCRKCCSKKSKVQQQSSGRQHTMQFV